MRHSQMRRVLIAFSTAVAVLISMWPAAAPHMAMAGGLPAGFASLCTTNPTERAPALPAPDPQGAAADLHCQACATASGGVAPGPRVATAALLSRDSSTVLVAVSLVPPATAQRTPAQSRAPPPLV